MLKYINLTLSSVAVILVSYLLFTAHDSDNNGNQGSEKHDYEKTFATSGENKINSPVAKSYDIPTEINFAGEDVPLDKTYIRELLDRELHINIYWHNNTIFLMKRANRWFPQISKILAEQGIPDDFKYVTLIESSLRNVISPSGAVGFWQFMEGTAREYGLEITDEVDERYHPLKSTLAATKYLKDAYEKFGNWTNVAASYNRGMNGLRRDMERQDVDNYYDLKMNAETTRYIYRVLAVKEILSFPKQYGFDIKPEHLYQEEALKYITVSETIEDLTVWAKEQGITYLLLKRHNPWLISNQLKVPSGKSYIILIPEKL